MKRREGERKDRRKDGRKAGRQAARPPSIPVHAYSRSGKTVARDRQIPRSSRES